MKRIVLPNWVHSLLDLAPAIAFLFVLFTTRDFQRAAWYVVVGAAISLFVTLGIERRVRPIPTTVGVLALLFGGASVLFHRADILQMKMTIVDTGMALAIFAAVYLGRVPLKMFLGHVIDMEDRQWNVLAMRYACYCLTCAAANEVVRHTQTTYVWGIFRAGASAGNVVFVLFHVPFLLRHAKEIGKGES
jgi:intracellular septation protein